MGTIPRAALSRIEYLTPKEYLSHYCTATLTYLSEEDWTEERITITTKMQDYPLATDECRRQWDEEGRLSLDFLVHHFGLD